MRSHRAWRILPVFLLLLALTVPVLPAMAQDAGSILSVDTPSDGQMNELGQNVVFVGWAANRLGSGTGVDRVMVLDAPMAAGGVTVAEATYGLVRADVGSAYIPSWANSGFRATWMAVGSTGNRTFWVYAHSVDNDGWTNKTVTIRETEATMPAPAAVAPVAAAPVQTTNDQTSRYRNQNGLYGTGCDQYSNQYNNQNMNQYNNQYSQYNNQNQYCNQNGQYYNNGQSYNSQYPNQYDQNGNLIGTYNPQTGQYSNSQYQCDMYGNPIGSSNGYNSGQYNSQYGISTNYGCSGYPTTTAGSTVTGTTGADGTISVTWTPVASATQGYRVYLSTSSYPVAIVAQSFGASASATVSGLTPNSVVSLQVRGVTNNNSETAIGAVWSTPTVSTAAPLGLTVGTKTATSVALTWTPSTSGGITAYLVQQSPIAGGPFTSSIVSGASSSSALVGSLLPNTWYWFQVTAMGAGGLASAPSIMVNAQTPTS